MTITITIQVPDVSVKTECTVTIVQQPHEDNQALALRIANEIERRQRLVRTR